jgi:hypothetical protein
MSQELRYWDRVGMYVTREFAEEWAEKLKSGSDGTRGKYLDDDIEEYIIPETVSVVTIRNEVEELFNSPFETIELPKDTQAIIKVNEMEKKKVSRIKALKAEGYSLQEAKELAVSEINQAVAKIMGIDLDDYAERQDAYVVDNKEGAEAQEASVDDSEE